MLQNIRSIATPHNINLTLAADPKQVKEVDEISTTSSNTTTNFTGNKFADQ
jgi:hypothetical protein